MRWWSLPISATLLFLTFKRNLLNLLLIAIWSIWFSVILSINYNYKL
jgi:hypothetical protein